MATLYDEVLLDHIKNARNYRVPPRVSRKISGSNALCGDELSLYLDIDGGRIVDIGFQCAGCGLSMASASVMTELVRGKSTAEAALMLRVFAGNLGGTPPSGSANLNSAQRALLDAARRFPSRARCVAMPWTTLTAALPGAQSPVAPESTGAAGP